MVSHNNSHNISGGARLSSGGGSSNSKKSAHNHQRAHTALEGASHDTGTGDGAYVGPRLLQLGDNFVDPSRWRDNLDSFLARCEIETHLDIKTVPDTDEDAHTAGMACCDEIESKITMTEQRTSDIATPSKNIYCVVLDRLDVLSLEVISRLKWHVVLGGLSEEGMAPEVLGRISKDRRFVWFPYWTNIDVGVCCYKRCGRTFEVARGYYSCSACSRSFYCSQQCQKMDLLAHWDPELNVCRVSHDHALPTAPSVSLFMLKQTPFYKELANLISPMSTAVSDSNTNTNTNIIIDDTNADFNADPDDTAVEYDDTSFCSDETVQ